jgi:DnaJ-class molecular chaperone
MMWWQKQKCPSCSGDGWERVRVPAGVRRGPDGCPTCNGQGVIFYGLGDLEKGVFDQAERSCQQTLH